MFLILAFRNLNADDPGTVSITVTVKLYLTALAIQCSVVFYCAAYYACIINTRRYSMIALASQSSVIKVFVTRIAGLHV